MNKEELWERYMIATRLQMEADQHLSHLLSDKYGKRAGDMRYAPAETSEIAAAMDRYKELGQMTHAAWLDTLVTPVIK